MVAPVYAEKHSVLAKSIGLGRKPRGAAAPEVEPPPEEEHITPIPRTRGRKLAKAAEAHEE